MVNSHIYLIVALIFLCIKELITIFEIHTSLNFYKNHKLNQRGNCPTCVPIIVVIPVLREQNIIEDTVRYFNSLNYPTLKLVIVTTEKEFSSPIVDNSYTTIDIVKKLISQYNLHWIHYPFTDGMKADQVNYAVSQFQDLFPEYNVTNSFIALYDADSRPHIETFNELCRLVMHYPENNVFQQSSIFYKNFNQIGDENDYLAGSFLQAQALRATRFVFAYELPRIVNQLAYYNRKHSWRSVVGSFTYAHCVGHGLFLRASFAQSIPFPPNVVLEDMFYGFILNYLREPIIPVPVLTNCEIPSSIKQMFIQNSRWFLGPSRCLLYLQYAREKYPKFRNDFRNYGLLLFGYYTTLIWILMSFITMTMLIYIGLSILGIPNMNLTNLIIIYLSGMFLYLYLWGVYILLRNHSVICSLANTKSKDTLSLHHKLKVIIGFVGVILFHSIPPYYTIYGLIFRKTKNVKNTKTER